jgi:hypothetical protein
MVPLGRPQGIAPTMDERAGEAISHNSKGNMVPLGRPQGIAPTMDERAGEAISHNSKSLG